MGKYYTGTIRRVFSRRKRFTVKLERFEHLHKVHVDYWFVVSDDHVT